MTFFTLQESFRAWTTVYDEVSAHEPGTRVRYPKSWLPHPREAGAHVSVGIPVGQQGDYRFAPDASCRGLHVQDFGDDWIVHLDRVHPACDVVEHVRRDAPKAWVAGGAGVGAALGLAVSGGKKEGLFLGAALGLLTAALTVPKADVPEPEPER